jgi:hypothetical protein
MNDWQAKKERQTLRHDVLALIEAQKAVIGALAQAVTQMREDIAALKQQVGRPTVTVTKDAEVLP